MREEEVIIRLRVSQDVGVEDSTARRVVTGTPAREAQEDQVSSLSSHSIYKREEGAQEEEAVERVQEVKVQEEKVLEDKQGMMKKNTIAKKLGIILTILETGIGMIEFMKTSPVALSVKPRTQER